MSIALDIGKFSIKLVELEKVNESIDLESSVEEKYLGKSSPVYN